MKENDLVVRIWPSGNITMGKAFKSNRLMFYSLENYHDEGGVSKYNIFGYIDTSQYKHRLATEKEIFVFNKRGFLGITESEIIEIFRDEKLNQLL
jgi:hypothetical protein